MWNVKLKQLARKYYTDKVLIETLWNVKLHKSVSSSVNFNVLIETLWNVKSIASSAVSIATTRINRNIVECKDHC